MPPVERREARISLRTRDAAHFAGAPGGNASRSRGLARPGVCRRSAPFTGSAAAASLGRLRAARTRVFEISHASKYMPEHAIALPRGPCLRSRPFLPESPNGA